MVYTSPYHGRNEREENERFARIIADNTGKKVYLLPCLNSDTPAQIAMRRQFLPPSVIGRKNPDFMIDGKLFDGKCMLGIDASADSRAQHNAILNHIKSAKKQADNVVLEVPEFISRTRISDTINGFLKQSKHERIIIVIHKGKFHIYKQPQNKF